MCTVYSKASTKIAATTKKLQLISQIRYEGVIKINPREVRKRRNEEQIEQRKQSKISDLNLTI